MDVSQTRTSQTVKSNQMNSHERLRIAAEASEVELDVYLNGYRITKWWNVGNSFGLEARHMGLHIPWLGEASYFNNVGVQCTPIGRDVCFYGPYEFIESVHVGKIRLTKARHTQILRQLAYGRYKPGEYDIAFNNCLDFCSDMLLCLGLKAENTARISGSRSLGTLVEFYGHDDQHRMQRVFLELTSWEKIHRNTSVRR